MLMCDKLLFYTALFSIIIHDLVVRAGTFEESQGLYNFLEQKIDTRLRPILNQSDVLYVHVLPSIVSLQSLEEKTQVLHTTLALLLHWNSETLQWLPSLFGGTAIAQFSPNHIWTPDLVYQNAVGDTFYIELRESMKVSVAANGYTVWNPGSYLDTTCRVDITRYPFDTQTCKIIIGKFHSFDYEIMLIPQIDSLDYTVYEENDEWIIKDSNIRHKQIADQINFIEVELVLERRYLFHLLNTIIPVIIVSLLNVFSFRLPIQRGERMGYCISLFLTFIILLNTISDSMPQVSKNISYLQLYVNIQLIIGTMIIAISILLVKITQDKTIPKWIITLSKINCIQKVKPLLNQSAESTVTYDISSISNEEKVQPLPNQRVESHVTGDINSISIEEKVQPSPNQRVESHVTDDTNSISIEEKVQTTSNQRAESTVTDDAIKTKDKLLNSNDLPAKCNTTDNMVAVNFIDKVCFWFFMLLFLMSTLICILLMTV